MLKNKEIRKLAKLRANCFYHLIFFAIINFLLWAFWIAGNDSDNLGKPWPIIITIFWGLVLSYKFWKAFGTKIDFIEEREYQKLKKKYNQ